MSVTPSRGCPLSRILRGTWEMTWTVSEMRNGLTKPERCWWDGTPTSTWPPVIQPIATSGSRFGLVRIHLDPGLVAPPACLDAGGTTDSTENGSDHTPGQRR